MKWSISFLLILFCLNVFATPQVPDNILYNGTKYMLFSNPLNFYFVENIDKIPTKGEMPSNLLRKYIADFEIKDKQLFLEDVKVWVFDDSKDKEDMPLKEESVLNDIFPKKKEVLANWFSGLLIIPYGEMVKRVYMGYQSTYENYIILEIDKGKLIKEIKLDNKGFVEFKAKKIEEYKLTEDYDKLTKTWEENRKDLPADHYVNADDYLDSVLESEILNTVKKI